jgi:hypothetical protein
MLDLDAHVGVIYSAIQSKSRLSSSPSNVRLRCHCVEYLIVQRTLKEGRLPSLPQMLDVDTHVGVFTAQVGSRHYPQMLDSDANVWSTLQ